MNIQGKHIPLVCCTGKSEGLMSAYDLIKAAVEMGLPAIGIVDYPFTLALSIALKWADIASDWNWNKGKIKVLCGVEFMVVKDKPALLDCYLICFAKNQQGVLNLYNLVSAAKEYHVGGCVEETKAISESDLQAHLDGLLIGAYASPGQYMIAQKMDNADWTELYKKCDFFLYDGFYQTAHDHTEILNMLSHFESFGKPICGYSLGRYRKETDGETCFSYTDYAKLGTNEVLGQLQFLGKEKAYEFAVRNPQKIADMCDTLQSLDRYPYRNGDISFDVIDNSFCLDIMNDERIKTIPDNLKMVEQNGKYGIVHFTDDGGYEPIIPIEYDRIVEHGETNIYECYEQGLFLLYKNCKIGLCKIKAKRDCTVFYFNMLLPCEYYAVADRCHYDERTHKGCGIILFEKEDGVCYYNTETKFISDRYSSIAKQDFPYLYAYKSETKYIIYAPTDTIIHQEPPTINLHYYIHCGATNNGATFLNYDDRELLSLSNNGNMSLHLTNQWFTKEITVNGYNIANVVCNQERDSLGVADEKCNMIMDTCYDEIQVELKITAMRGGEKVEKVFPVPQASYEKGEVSPFSGYNHPLTHIHKRE